MATVLVSTHFFSLLVKSRDFCKMRNKIDDKNGCEDLKILAFNKKLKWKELKHCANALSEILLFTLFIGAHIVGKITRYLKLGLVQEAVGTIIALDPAGGHWPHTYTAEDLAKSDAKYVLAIHTDVNRYGTQRALGHGGCGVHTVDTMILTK